jgi:micrococcal nuclease
MPQEGAAVEWLCMLRKILLLLAFCSSLAFSGAQPVSRPAASTVQLKQSEQTVYITRTGKKYHRAGCRYLSHSSIPVSLRRAQANGYEPCSICHPPGRR